MKKLIKQLLEKTKLVVLYKICKFTDKELLEIAAKNHEKDYEFIKDSTELFVEKLEKLDEIKITEDDFIARMMYLALFESGEDFESFCIRKQLKPAILQKYKLYKKKSKMNSTLEKSFDSLRKEYSERINHKIDKSIDKVDYENKGLEGQIETLRQHIDKLPEKYDDNVYGDVSPTSFLNKDFFNDIKEEIRKEDLNRTTPGFSVFKSIVKNAAEKQDVDSFYKNSKEVLNRNPFYKGL